MASPSCILAWKIPWTEEPSCLQSIGSQRVRHDWTHDIWTIILIYFLFLETELIRKNASLFLVAKKASKDNNNFIK